MLYSHDDYEKDPFLAVDDIAALLRDGCLTLFLGAGASAGFGLPEWMKLVANVLGKGSDGKFVRELKKKSAEEVARLVDEVDNDTPEYVESVHKALYANAPLEILEILQKSALLLSVAALVTGTCRGRIGTVFTYNYDDLLEQYLEMLGYSCCIRTHPSEFSRRADVEINHVHGFLPQRWKRGDNCSDIILSERSFSRRRSEIDKGWGASIEHQLHSKCGLFIGMSGNDGSVLDVLLRAKNSIKRAADYTGFWLLTPDAYVKNRKRIVTVGMCPIKLQIGEIPKFIFKVCQVASPKGCCLVE